MARDLFAEAGLAPDAQAATTASGPRDLFAEAGMAPQPIKIGRDAFADTLRDTLRGTDWGTRNIAGAGSAVINAWEGLKGLVGKTSQQNVRDQALIAQEAPIGNLGGNAGLAYLTGLIPGATSAPASGKGALQLAKEALQSGAIGGATMAATTPGDATVRLKAGLLGAAGAGGGTALGNYAAGRSRIGANPDAVALMQQGISLTPGQNAGGVLKTIEDKAASWPLVGNVIQNARTRGIEDFDRAAFNRVLTPLQAVDNTIQPASTVGREGFQNLKQTMTDAYGNLLPKLNNIHADAQFQSDMSQLKQLASNLPKDRADQFNNLIDYYVTSRFNPAGRMSGETMKQVESDLGRESLGYRGSADFDSRKLGDALRQAQDNLREMVKRTNPANGDDLQKVNEAFANYARLRQASSMQGTAANAGLFTPAQLNNAVRAGDKTAGKSAYASGNALMQDLTDPAMRIMPSRVPNSGTADRLMADLTNPLNWPALAGKATLAPLAMAAYSRPGSAAINAGVNNGILPLANLIQQSLGSPGLLRTGGLTLAELASH